MTEVQTRGYGFNWSIKSGDAILQNFDTGAIEENEPQNYFTYTITGRPTQFTAQLQTGDIFMIPLFYDSGNNNTSTTITHS
ncbi:hypothetical protein IJM86_06430 [bacterium]|nr:hypothetical protein [bacterium]